MFCVPQSSGKRGVKGSMQALVEIFFADLVERPSFEIETRTCPACRSAEWVGIEVLISDGDF